MCLLQATRIVARRCPPSAASSRRPGPPARLRSAVLPLLVLAGCASAPPIVPEPPAPLETTNAAEAELSPAEVETLARELMDEAARHTVAELTPRTLNYRTLWATLGPLIDVTEGMHRVEIGRSVEGRTLYAVEYGQGHMRVMLWSQMHGNEPTATLALADLVRYFAENPHDERVLRIRERLTLVAIPMLNPDGAERNRRENAAGLDINRDARRQRSPEARALAAVHARVGPHFGFNLHDQSPRLDEAGRPVAISLLAPPHELSGADVVHMRAMRVASLMRMAADPLVDTRVTRYDEEYNGQAFGDAMQSWGTSTVLLETGAWDDDPDKAYLRQVNFAVLLTALDAIATGSFQRVGVQGYQTLPRSSR